MPASDRQARQWIIVLIGATGLGLILGYRIRHNPQWQDFAWSRLAETLLGVDPYWALAALGAVYSTYLVRALRWRTLMKQIKAHPDLWNLFSATVIGFAAIGILGRAGEMVRPYLVARKESVRLSGQLAVWLVERSLDTLTLLVTAAFALGQFEAAGLRDSPVLTQVLHTGGRVVAISSVVLVLLLIGLRNFAGRLAAWAVARVPPKWEHLRHQIQAFEEGTRGLHKLSSLAACLVYSVAEWVLIALCYAAVFNSFSGGMRLTASQTVIFMGCVMAGSVINIPGIGGGIQVASVLVLTELFGLRPEPAAGISLLIWGFTFLAVVPPAAILMVYEGLTWGKLRRLESEN